MSPSKISEHLHIHLILYIYFKENKYIYIRTHWSTRTVYFFSSPTPVGCLCAHLSCLNLVLSIVSTSRWIAGDTWVNYQSSSRGCGLSVALKTTLPNSCSLTCSCSAFFACSYRVCLRIFDIFSGCLNTLPGSFELPVLLTGEGCWGSYEN